jgi:Uma2 family endonuclease
MAELVATLPAPARVLEEGVPYEEFLRRYDGTFADWVDGCVVASPGVSSRHQQVVLRFMALLSFWAEERRPGRVLMRFQLRLGPDGPGREPDVLFLAAEREHLMREMHIEGPADLVAEVVDAHTVELDRVVKFREYEQAGVHEYWMIDLPREEVVLFRRSGSGAFERIDAVGDPPRLVSEVMDGMWMRPEWLLEDTKLLSVVRSEWRLHS